MHDHPFIQWKVCFIFVSILFLSSSSLLADTSIAELKTPLILLKDVPFSVSLSDLRDHQKCILQIEQNGKLIDSQTVEVNENEMCSWGNLLVPETGKVNLQVLVDGQYVLDKTLRVLPGWLSLLPPLLAVLLAIITRQVILSLIVGIWIGATMIANWSPFTGFLRTLDNYIIHAYTNVDHVYIICFSLLLGGMVGIISRSGGTQGLVNALQRIARTSRSVQFSTWLMGVLIFFDDYANTLFVGSSMRPLTDRFRVSREKLSYLIDTTAAPVANIAIISTWIGFEVSIIGDVFTKLSINQDPYLTFIQSIPYRFYPIMALIFPLILIFMRRDFGPMYRAEMRARQTGALLAPNAVPLSDYESNDLMPLEGARPHWALAIIPIVSAIVAIIVGLLATGYEAVKINGSPDGAPLANLQAILAEADSFRSLLWGAAIGCVVAGILAIVYTRMKVQQVFDAWIAGMRAMFLAIIILGLAWAIGEVCGDVLTADYLVHFLGPHLSIYWIPALTTLVSAVISFSTGSSWTTMGIVMPLVIPLVHLRAIATGVENPHFFLIATISSVLAGATFGDHCSPISDTTILSSIFSGADHIDHVRTQIPYAITCGLIAWVFGDWLTAYGFPWWGSILLGTALMIILVRLIGKPVPEFNPHENG